MFFGLFKMFKSFLLNLTVPVCEMGITTESQCVKHAAFPKRSNWVRRPEQDDYG